MNNKWSLLSCLASLFVTTSIVHAQDSAPGVPTKQAELHTWQTYSIKDERVSAKFPTHPAMSTSHRFRELLRQRLTDRMIGAYADGVVYGIYTYDNPKPRDSFDDFIAREGRDVSTAQPVKLDRFTGKQFSGRMSTAQFFAVEDRFYKFTATGASADDPGVKQFFSSITLGSKKGIEVSDGPGTPFSHPSSAEILTGKQVDTKIRLVMKPEPSYTARARQEQVMGTVILKAVFASSGSVTNIRAVQKLPYGLTEEAVAAAKKIKFIPAMKDGKYVSMWIQLEYNFNLY